MLSPWAWFRYLPCRRESVLLLSLHDKRKIGKVGQRMRNSFNTISCLVWSFCTKKQDMTHTLQKTSKAICRCGFKLRAWIWVRIISDRATHSDLCRDSQSSVCFPLLSSRCSWAPRMCQGLWGHQASSDLPRFYPENTVPFWWNFSETIFSCQWRLTPSPAGDVGTNCWNTELTIRCQDNCVAWVSAPIYGLYVKVIIINVNLMQLHILWIVRSNYQRQHRHENNNSIN